MKCLDGRMRVVFRKQKCFLYGSDNSSLNSILQNFTLIANFFFSKSHHHRNYFLHDFCTTNFLTQEWIGLWEFACKYFISGSSCLSQNFTSGVAIVVLFQYPILIVNFVVLVQQFPQEQNPPNQNSRLSQPNIMKNRTKKMRRKSRKRSWN